MTLGDWWYLGGTDGPGATQAGAILIAETNLAKIEEIPLVEAAQLRARDGASIKLGSENPSRAREREPSSKTFRTFRPLAQLVGVLLQTKGCRELELYHPGPVDPVLHEPLRPSVIPIACR